MLYQELDPEAEDGQELDALLSELGHLPLAVMLMAKVGALLKRWQARGGSHNRPASR